MKISVESILNNDSLKLNFDETVNPSKFHVSIKNRRTGKFHRVGVVLENQEVVIDYHKISKLDSLTDEESFTRFDVFAIDEKDVKYRIGVPESFEENLHEKVEIFKNEFAGNVRLYKSSSRELSLEISVIYLPFVSNIVESNVQVTVPPTMRNHEFTYYFEQKNAKKKLATEKFESFSIIDFSKLSPLYGDGKLSVVIKNTVRTRIRTTVFVGDKEVAPIDDDRVVEFLPNENDRLEIRITKRIRFTAQSINSHDIHFEAIDSLTDRPVQFGFAMKQRSTNLPLLHLPSIDNQIQGSDIDDVLANNLMIDGVVDFYYYDKNESFNFDNKSLEEQLEYVKRIPVNKFNTIRSIKIDRIVGYSLYTTVNNKLSLRVDPININKISQPKVDIIDDYLVFSGDVADSELLLRDKNKVNVLLPVVDEKVSLQKIIALSGEYGYKSPFALYLRFGSKTVARLSNYDVTDDDSYFGDIFEMSATSDSIYNQAVQIVTNDDSTLSLKLGSRHNLQRAQYGISTKVTNFLTTEQGYHFEATVSANNPERLQLSEALLINRNKLSYQEVPVGTSVRYNDDTLEFMVSIDVKPSESIQPIYQDMFIKATYENNDLLIKLNGTSKTVKNYVGNNIFEHEHDVLVNDVDADGQVISGDHMMYPYITVDGNLAFKFRKSRLKTKIINVDIINKAVILTFTLANPKNLNLKLKAVRYQSRTKIVPEVFDASVKINSENKAVSKLDLTKMELNQFYYDAFAIVEIDGYELQIEIKKSDARLRKHVQTWIKGHDYSDWKKRKVIYPIFIGNNFRLAMRDRDEAEKPYDFIKYQIAFWLYRIFKNHFNRKKIWLTYEKESKRAEDNSFYFFQYMYQQHPNQNVYFVMNANSHNFKVTKPYKRHVLKFMSIKHLIYLQAAELFVSSETPGHAFPWREKRGMIKKIIDQKPFVFLQHGVLGLKKVGRGLNKSGANSANLFVVSSQREQQLVVDNMNYLPNEVIITGLPRWDAIQHNAVSKPVEVTKIFIMPTWRSWLEDTDEKSFRKSMYFRYYNDLLSSDKFGKFLLDDNIEVRFLLHPKMRKYLYLFDKVSPNITLLSDEETQVNTELQRANILVTDYSSVAWEMLYRDKPTIFYQFDRNVFDLFTGSYINLDNELFGVKVSDVNGLIDNIGIIKANHFQLTQEQGSYRKKEFKFIDNRNSERIYQSITDSNILSPFTKVSLTKKVIKRIRKRFTN